MVFAVTYGGHSLDYISMPLLPPLTLLLALLCRILRVANDGLFSWHSQITLHGGFSTKIPCGHLEKVKTQNVHRRGALFSR